MVAETMQPGMSISYVARRHGLSPSLVFRWRRLMSEGHFEPARTSFRLRKPASSRTASASSNVFWVARPWRLRSSKRLSTLHGQKNRPCCRARQVREIPREDRRRHIASRPIQHHRTARRLSAATRSSEPCRRSRFDCRHPPPRRPAAHLVATGGSPRSSSASADPPDASPSMPSASSA